MLGDISIIECTDCRSATKKDYFEVDSCYEEEVKKHSWRKNYNHATCNDRYYRVVSDMKGTNYNIAAFILGLANVKIEDGYVPNHINGNVLDNRLSNLGSVPRKINNSLKVYNKNGSPALGMCWHSPSNRWRVRYIRNGKEYYAGACKTYKEALEKAVEFYGNEYLKTGDLFFKIKFDNCREALCQLTQQKS